jgi:D-glycero-alpha-D-manno-heptose-7-phosphate kinase
LVKYSFSERIFGSPVIIESSAPTRVDLAGGTIDIWPLYLFHPGAATVNFAIDLLAQCRIETRDDDRVILESRDRELMLETNTAGLGDLLREERLELISKLVHFFKPKVGFHLIADCQAPAGAGLGGSSALAIACIGALNRLCHDRYRPEQLIPLAANIESTVIRVPAGYQDYYPAQFGGALCLHFRPDGIEAERLKIDLATLEQRIAICYTGEPRLSGTNNWEITKRHIDGDTELFELFEGIRDTSLTLRGALLQGDWPAVSETLSRAHPARKRLAPNITTPHMDRLIDAALGSGAEAAKVCGAGGGGCIAFFCATGRRAEVEERLSREPGVKVLDWSVAQNGLSVTES